MPKNHQNQLFSHMCDIMLSFPYKLHCSCSSPPSTRLAATHLHGGAEGCCSLCPCLRCNPSCTEAAPVLAARKFSNKISCSFAYCWAAVALLFFFPSLLPAFHPQSLPHNQSAVLSQKSLSVKQIELLTGCSPFQSQHRDPSDPWLSSSPLVSASSVLQGQSQFLHIRLEMLHGDRIAMNSCYSKTSGPLFLLLSVSCINYKENIQNIV